VRWLPEGILLWARVHSGALAGAQGRVQADRGGSGKQREVNFLLKLMIVKVLAAAYM
jgi:hypothetical protein